MIRLQGLSKSFGSKKALVDLSLEIRAGEFFCFLGPNGAGKTTTIRILTGLLKPDAGSVEVGGLRLEEDPIAVKRLLGYVPDQPFLYDKLTVWELMELVAGLYRLERGGLEERIRGWLRQFEIEKMADQLVEDLSHGMRQKLSFASTFLHDPSVVVVDEPWVGLDPKNIRAVKDFLRRRCDEGLTVFMSTHTLSIAEELADRIGIIHRGRLLHVGSVREILALARQPGNLEDVFLELTSSEGEAA